MWGVAGIAGFLGLARHSAAAAAASAPRPSPAEPPLSPNGMRQLQRILHRSASQRVPAAASAAASTSGKRRGAASATPLNPVHEGLEAPMGGGAGDAGGGGGGGGEPAPGGGTAPEATAAAPPPPQPAMHVSVEVALHSVGVAVKGLRQELLTSLQLTGTCVQLAAAPGQVTTHVTVSDVQVRA